VQPRIRDAKIPEGRFGEIEDIVLALRGEAHYEDFQYALLLQMRAINRVGTVQRPERSNFRLRSPAGRTLIHDVLTVSRRRIERHLAPLTTYLKAGRMMRSQLRAYADSYFKAGKDYDRWRCTNPRLSEEFERDLETLRMKLSPTSAGHVSMELESRKKDRPLANARLDAAILFLRCLEKPFAIGRCTRCAQYFLNRTRRERRYCSRKCALHVTAIEATRRRREREKQEKLGRVQDAVSLWERHRPRGDWKSWVAARAGVTSKWITRALNKKGIKPPEGFK
jgi:hypothetical protein